MGRQLIQSTRLGVVVGVGWLVAGQGLIDLTRSRSGWVDLARSSVGWILRQQLGSLRLFRWWSVASTDWQQWMVVVVMEQAFDGGGKLWWL